MLHTELIILLLTLGAGAGFLAGLLGVGGGMVLVPFLTAIYAQQGFDHSIVVKLAIGTSLSTILFTSIASIAAHHRYGRVRWDLSVLLAPAVALGSLLGAQFAVQLKSAWLSVTFGAVVSLIALQMLRSATIEAKHALPARGITFLIGNIIGFIAGIVGAGGGFLTVPFLTRCNVSIHNAVATSATLGFPIALAGAMGYSYSGFGLESLPKGSIGFIHIPTLLTLVVASMACAPLGAKVAQKCKTHTLKRIFAVLLLGLALSMIYYGLTL